MLVISYYTINTPYEDVVQNLIQSLDALDIPHDIQGISDLGYWEANTHYKAQFIKSMLQKHPNEKLLFVDADAIVNAPLIELENIDCDISVRFQDFPWRKNECLSGSILLCPTENTHTLVDTWIEFNEKIGGQRGEKPEEFEQNNLKRAIETMPELRVHQLPPEYVFIFDHMKRMFPHVTPVIEHFQASRKYRKPLRKR